MTTVIAALDNSLAVRPVLATATGLAHLLGAEVVPLHVGTGRAEVAQSAADAVGLRLRIDSGPTLETLVAAGSQGHVAAMVAGARGMPGTSRPVGGTALELVTRLSKPVVVVPPDAPPRTTLRRLLVPLDGTISAALTPKAIFELASGAQLEVVVVHVHDEDSVPAFTDQPQHEATAWAEEFLARYCPWGVDEVRLEIRVGRREDEILRAAEDSKVDLIALGWSQELAPGRAPVVRAVLERGHIPVLLAPVRAITRSAKLSITKEEPWNRSLSSHA